ncbi:glycosyl hydrolase family 28-related protein [Janibacter sp. CX7]|uniref:glycosyl hydrolase family 28-related protein n=1 Tax=Janibacter sp. CX7 TaxID=2963431 RepID=UPI00350E5511
MGAGAAYVIGADGRPPLSVLDKGAVGDGVTDDTRAVQMAIDEASRSRRPLIVPPGRYVVEAPIMVRGVAGFELDMQGAFVRKPNSAQQPLLSFVKCRNMHCRSIRLDGNVVGNRRATDDGGSVPFDEVSHSLRLDQCQDVRIDLLESVDPTGDVLYLAGGDGANERVSIERIVATSSIHSGRNVVSIVAGEDLKFGDVYGFNVGYPHTSPAMPGGFLIEPNRGDRVDGVSLRSATISTAGATGLGVIAAFGSPVNDVRVGRFSLSKLQGAPVEGCDVHIRGAQNVRIELVEVSRAVGVSTQVLAIDDARHIRVGLVADRIGPRGVSLGQRAGVENLQLTGALTGGEGNLIDVYGLSQSSIAMTLRDPGVNSGLISKAVSGRSTGVRISGDLSRGARGAFGIGGPGDVEGWKLEGVQLKGWPKGTACRFVDDGSAQVM